MASHNVAVAKTAVLSGKIDVLMFPVNLYQHYGKAERRSLLETCVQEGVGVVAMKAYYGGRLLGTEYNPTAITPSQCLEYVLQQEVSTIAVGARNAEHMRQAVSYLEAKAEDRNYSHIPDEMEKWLRGLCVQCKHCLPCPVEINIPNLLWLLDYADHYGHVPRGPRAYHDRYGKLMVKASACTECGLCEERCPFGVEVTGKMRHAVDVFGT
jgi:predicted aldo/keto reductase-like oxidoreductase